MQNTEWKMLEEFGSAPLPRIGGRAVIETSGKLWGFGGTLGPPRDGAPRWAGGSFAFRRGVFLCSTQLEWMHVTWTSNESFV